MSRAEVAMPVLVIAVVFFIIFLIMGVMLSSAMLAEHHTNNVIAREAGKKWSRGVTQLQWLKPRV